MRVRSAGIETCNQRASASILWKIEKDGKKEGPSFHKFIRKEARWEARKQLQYKKIRKNAIACIDIRIAVVSRFRTCTSCEKLMNILNHGRWNHMTDDSSPFWAKFRDRNYCPCPETSSLPLIQVVCVFKLFIFRASPCQHPPSIKFEHLEIKRGGDICLFTWTDYRHPRFDIEIPALFHKNFHLILYCIFLIDRSRSIVLFREI
jgi:hypothetical protein